MMESSLVVSSTDKSAVFFSEILEDFGIKNLSVLFSAEEARRLLMEQNFDLVIIDGPLLDESGESLSHYIASNSFSQVIFALMSDNYEEIASSCKEEGILTISKPVNRELLRSSICLAKSADTRIKRIYAENIRLKQKIDDIRIIDRAKCMLISYLNLSEQEAHRFIEKQAMDLRSPKRAIAEGILKTYAS